MTRLLRIVHNTLGKDQQLSGEDLLGKFSVI